MCVHKRFRYIYSYILLSTDAGTYAPFYFIYLTFYFIIVVIKEGMALVIDVLLEQVQTSLTTGSSDLTSKQATGFS